MMYDPLVSVIIPFYNTDPRFMKEAIESVIAQTYPHWEMLLIDDGSEDASALCARDYASRHPDNVRYVDHPFHENLGLNASCQLGITLSRGELIAFLDSDDLWLAHKLERQVELMRKHQEVGVLYGTTKYWRSWNDSDADHQRDEYPPLGVVPNTAFDGIKLLQLAVDQKIATPCPCSIMVRRIVIEQAGGFALEVGNTHSDRGLYTKVFPITKVLVSDECWDWYRIHEKSVSALASEDGKVSIMHLRYLEWAVSHLKGVGIDDPELWQVLHRQIWYYRLRHQMSKAPLIGDLSRRLIKWFMFVEERVVPGFIRRNLWR